MHLWIQMLDVANLKFAYNEVLISDSIVLKSEGQNQVWFFF